MTEILTESYKLINKLYNNLINKHERSLSREDLTLIKEAELFELKYGIEIEKLINKENGKNNNSVD